MSCRLVLIATIVALLIPSQAWAFRAPTDTELDAIKAKLAQEYSASPSDISLEDVRMTTTVPIRSLSSAKVVVRFDSEVIRSGLALVEPNYEYSSSDRWVGEPGSCARSRLWGLNDDTADDLGLSATSCSAGKPAIPGLARRLGLTRARNAGNSAGNALNARIRACLRAHEDAPDVARCAKLQYARYDARTGAFITGLRGSIAATSWSTCREKALRPYLRDGVRLRVLVRKWMQHMRANRVDAADRIGNQWSSIDFSASRSAFTEACNP